MLADKGDISKSFFARLWKKGRHPITGSRGNMRNHPGPILDKLPLQNRLIPHSLQNPKLLAGHDLGVIGDGVAPCRPLLWQSSAEEIEDGLDEEREARMERVVRHYPGA